MSVFIIAEAGVNHNGDIKLAKKMIEIASDLGVDAVKFQIFKAAKVVSKEARLAEYQSKNMGKSGMTQYQMLESLELGIKSFEELSEHCKKYRVVFMASPFDLESVDFLTSIKAFPVKIPSGEINNVPYLEKIGSIGNEVILSTGMSDLRDIEAALKILTECGTPLEKVTVLHCNTEYPTPFSDVNLYAMKTIEKAFPGLKVGYSDHTNGIEVPIAAVALGAKVIEKHFTLDKSLPGPDHKASLEPEELKQMVISIRNIEKALGTGWKKPSESEMKNIKIARRSIVAAKTIKKGELFTKENLALKRPGDGLSPVFWYEIIGKKSNYDFFEDEKIKI
jgi:N,N'-diacetyllegionaminate synthase